MSLIQHQQASYAIQLRGQLELAGCETRVAAVLSRTVGELIDHVQHAQDDMRHEIQEKEFRASMRKTELATAKGELFDRFMGVTLFAMVVSLVSGVLIALFR